MQYDKVIVGAGIAVLACAKFLQLKNISLVIVASGDRPGGIIKTDTADEYRLEYEGRDHIRTYNFTLVLPNQEIPSVNPYENDLPIDKYFSPALSTATGRGSNGYSSPAAKKQRLVGRI